MSLSFSFCGEDPTFWVSEAAIAVSWSNVAVWEFYMADIDSYGGDNDRVSDVFYMKGLDWGARSSYK